MLWAYAKKRKPKWLKDPNKDNKQMKKQNGKKDAKWNDKCSLTQTAK